MSNTHNALIHAKQDGTGEEVANNLSGGGGSDLSDYAKQEELSNLVLTGTTNTSGTTIAAGTCFVLNGDFVTAKTAIASGATFTLNTNYEKKSVGSILTELNSNLSRFGKTITNGSADMEKYNVFIVQLLDNWVTGTPIISVTFVKTMSIAFPYVVQNAGTAAVGYIKLGYYSNTKHIVVVDSWCTVNSSNAPTITNIVGVC